MSKTVEIFLIDAFTKEVDKGNRAGVVFDADGLSEQEMQRIAAFANVSETAFVIGSDDKNSHDVYVRYFTPTSEVPICGHATIATHYLRSQKLGLETGRILAKTGIGVLPVDIVKEGNDVKIIMTQGTPEMGHILTPAQKKLLLDALHITEDDLVDDLPVQAAGLEIIDITSAQSDLEDVFLKMTSAAAA